MHPPMKHINKLLTVKRALRLGLEDRRHRQHRQYYTKANQNTDVTNDP